MLPISYRANTEHKHDKIIMSQETQILIALIGGIPFGLIILYPILNYRERKGIDHYGHDDWENKYEYYINNAIPSMVRLYKRHYKKIEGT